MLRMFGFLPPAGCYLLAVVTMGTTYWVQTTIVEAGGAVDTRIYVVGGIVAFLLAFAGFQKSLEQKENAQQPRVSSEEVMQKLTPTETGNKDGELDVPPPLVGGPAADSPLGRVRARSGSPSAELERPVSGLAP